MIKPLENVKISLKSGEDSLETFTEKDGFFKFEWSASQILEPGTYKVQIVMLEGESEIARSEGEIIIPAPSSYNFISDIDDTFLISHSTNLSKRLFVLLTENARSRRPFEGAVEHYRLLNGPHGHEEGKVFFYVSSSEWNLYNYIREFIRINQLPQGVFFLNPIKTFSRILSTGQGQHDGKLTRIERIMKMYPDQVFVLLGDDSQRDIFIYTTIVEAYAKNIRCVYIRRVHTAEKPHVVEKQRVIESHGVLFFYFAHSDEAIAHSQKHGLIYDADRVK